MNKKFLSIAYWIALGVVAVVGLAAIFIRAQAGLQVSNLTTLVPWGLWVALYIYFIGLSAGSFLISTMIYVFGIKRFEPIGRIALFSAFISLCTGLVFIFLDLGHMERFWTVFVNRSSTSVLEWEIHFYNLYLVIMLAELWLLMRRDLIRKGGETGLVGLVCRLLAFGSKDLSDESAEKDMRMVKILGTLGVPVALGVHGGTGAIFAVVKARPYWNTGLFPLIFIVSALASGGALLTFIYAFFGRKDNQHIELTTALGKMVAGFLALDLIFLSSELLVGLYSNIPDHAAAYQSIMFGPSWFVFWIVQLTLGALIPFFLILNKRTGNSPGWIGMASALVVIGIVGVRLNIVIPPFTVALMPGLNAAYPLERFSTFEFIGFPALLFGAAIFIFILAAGMIIRFLSQMPSRPAERWLARAASIVVMTGFLAMGWQFIAGGTPLSAAITGAHLPLVFSGSILDKNAALYSPSDLEWLSSMGVIALATMGFTLGWILLPLEETHEELAAESDRFARLKTGR